MGAVLLDLVITMRYISLDAVGGGGSVTYLFGFINAQHVEDQGQLSCDKFEKDMPLSPTRLLR